MALSAKTRAEIVDLIAYEADFERPGISGCIVRDSTACPRQGDMPKDTYSLLMRQIGRGLVQYVVFSYTTPIAWVYTNGSVNLPDIKYSATTSTHQQMVRGAFGDLVNHNLLPEPQDDEAPVALTDKGREHLDQIQPVVTEQAQVSQYADLTVDELIDLASNLGGYVTASSTAIDGRRAALELVAVVGALKDRNEASRPSRRRIGEYLRQQGILEAKYEKDLVSDSYSQRNAKPVSDVLSEVRSDLYAGTATLKLSDLRVVVSPLVRDSRAQFDAEQQRRLELWQTKKLSEKQAALLECIAKGHMSRYHSMGNTSYSGDDTGTWKDDSRCKTCQRPDGRTMEAMRRKGVFGTIALLSPSAGGSRNTLMLLDPEKTDK